MQTTYQSLKVFIASPSDVLTERKMVNEAIQRINSTSKETLGWELESVSWEDFVPQTPKIPEEKIQDILNAEIAKCHIFILILYKRYGTREQGRRKSNTEREVDTAIDLLKREKKIMFLSYFRDIPKNIDIGIQEKRVTRLRNSLEAQGIWYKRYSEPHEFESLLIHALYRTLFRCRLSSSKFNALSKFWALGIADRPTQPKLAILYPSLERTYMGPQQDTRVWLERLEPNIVFEDYKALQKIEKSLRIIGFRDYRMYNTASLPADIQYMNRFWICLRNNPGLYQLSRYSEISNFRIFRGRARSASMIKWRRTARSRNYITVLSPLAKYLREQRGKMQIDGEWTREMDRIVVKDYAVLARLLDVNSDIAMDEGYLYDYFMAGLRGLGTWGAAWFIDRKCRHFEEFDFKSNIQMLLEIEYRYGRIFDVRDVSHKNQNYFSKENSISIIRSNIAMFRSTQW